MTNIVIFLIICFLLEAALCYGVKHDSDLKENVLTVMFTMLVFMPIVSLIITTIISVCIDLWYISLPATLFVITAIYYIYGNEIKGLVDDLKECRKERKGK